MTPLPASGADAASGVEVGADLGADADADSDGVADADTEGDSGTGIDKAAGVGAGPAIGVGTAEVPDAGASMFISSCSKSDKTAHPAGGCSCNHGDATGREVPLAASSGRIDSDMSF